MDEVKLINVPNDATITRVTKEIHSRGNVYAALDSRRTYLILSQRLRNTQVAIEELANEETKTDLRGSLLALQAILTFFISLLIASQASGS